MKLLLIETAADHPTSVDGDLRALGFAVDRVADARTAIDLAVKSDYDVILLDLTLPRDESLQILHEIREADHEVIILVLTGSEQIHDRVTALIQGADDFLVTPVAAVDLQARIRQLSGADSNRQSTAERGRQRSVLAGQPDIRIGELLRDCEQGTIELVISEVPLAALLNRIQSGLESTALARGVYLLLPQHSLPTLLVDAGWMQHLLANLLFNALVNGKPGNCVELRVSSNRESCRIDIESGHGFGRDLSIARVFARQLNLRIDSSGTRGGQGRVSIRGIKIR